MAMDFLQFDQCYRNETYSHYYEDTGQESASAYPSLMLFGVFIIGLRPLLERTVEVVSTAFFSHIQVSIHEFSREYQQITATVTRTLASIPSPGSSRNPIPCGSGHPLRNRVQRRP